MGPVAQVVLPGAALVAACLIAVCLAVLVAVLMSRATRRRRAALDDALGRAREEVRSLSRKVEELSDEVVRARRTADQDREYVITSLGSGDAAPALAPADGEVGEQAARPVSRPVSRPVTQPVSRVLEDQLVGALARQPRTSLVRARAVELVVRGVSLGHGVRRALSADVLDRAAAEAHVARRRSRRERKRQLRQARRVPDREVA